MKKIRNIIIIGIVLLGSLSFLSGCSEKNTQSTETKEITIKKIDAKEVLSLDKNADIFQWNGKIYKSGINWVDKLKLTKKELVGEISENSQKNFKDGVANKLIVGAKIYSPKERNDVLIVEFDGKTKYYLVQAEG